MCGVIVHIVDDVILWCHSLSLSTSKTRVFCCLCPTLAVRERESGKIRFTIYNHISKLKSCSTLCVILFVFILGKRTDPPSWDCTSLCVVPLAVLWLAWFTPERERKKNHTKRLGKYFELKLVILKIILDQNCLSRNFRLKMMSWSWSFLTQHLFRSTKMQSNSVIDDWKKNLISSLEVFFCAQLLVSTMSTYRCSKDQPT